MCIDVLSGILDLSSNTIKEVVLEFYGNFCFGFSTLLPRVQTFMKLNLRRLTHHCSAWRTVG